jgi:uncharacterized protein involved in response to NO
MASLLVLDEPRRPQQSATRRFALWDLGFRPFYLLASVFAALSVPLWIAQYAGIVPVAYVRSPVWHAHEMLFGYTLAVVTGFLFTAVRNWAGKPTPTGMTLAAFAALWLAGRILVLLPFPTAAAVVNAAFPIAVAIGIGIPLIQSRNRRNYFFVALLLGLGALQLALHLGSLDVVAWPARASLQVGLDVVLFIIAVMGGRVIPMFTNNGVPGTRATRRPIVERLALGSLLALLVADLLQAPPMLVVAVAAIAALAHAVRLYLWQPWRTLRTPLVWVLHAAYAWVVVYLALRALATFDVVPATLAAHALTIGVIGMMTIGMMTRTARGHTGRPLEADGFEVACYVLVLGAAVVRVFGGLLAADAYLASVVVSGLCWSAAFALYAIRYWPVLSRGRVDGKPG